LTLRVLYVLHTPDPLTYPDEQSFDSIATTVATTGQYGDPQPTARRLPSYVLFLATIYRIGGHHYKIARIMQSLCGTVMVLALMILAKKISGKPAVIWLTGLFSAIYPFFIYYDAKLLGDAFITWWLTFCILAFLLYQEDPQSWSRAVVWGISIAVLCLAKTVFIPIFAIIWAVEFYRHSAWSSRQRLILTACCLLVPLMGWGLRNERVLGQFALDTHTGYTAAGTIVFYQATKQNRLGEAMRNDPLFQQASQWPEIQREQFYKNQVKLFIWHHPRLFLHQCLANLKNFWRFYPRQDIQFHEGTRTLTVVSLLTEPFLILAGAIGLYKSKRDWKRLYPIYLSILLLTLIHALVSGQMRYRLPLMPFFILFAAMAITDVKMSDHKS